MLGSPAYGSSHPLVVASHHGQPPFTGVPGEPRPLVLLEALYTPGALYLQSFGPRLPACPSLPFVWPAARESFGSGQPYGASHLAGA